MMTSCMTSSVLQPKLSHCSSSSHSLAAACSPRSERYGSRVTAGGVTRQPLLLTTSFLYSAARPSVRSTLGASWRSVPSEDVQRRQWSSRGVGKARTSGGEGASAGAAVAEEAKGGEAGRRPYSKVKEIQEQLATGQRTAVSITEEYLRRLEEKEGQLRSFLHVDRDSALRQAAEIDARLSSGSLETFPPLLGLPVAVKDNLCTRDMPSTGGSKILEGYCPPYDAAAVERLRANGAVIVGKTNMDEFGMGSTTETSGYQVTSNPWDLDRVPGGSSGGSGSAVGGGQVAAALGSDTGGSVRLPASFCGCVGLKPTYGRVSRFGLFSYASSLDVVGPMASSVADAALLLQAIAGTDRRDATSATQPVADYSSSLLPLASLPSLPLSGLRLGLIAETIGEGVDADVAGCIRAALKHFEALGATVEEVSLPEFPHGLPAYYILAPSEASSNLARYDGVRYGPRKDGEDLVQMYGNSRGEGFGPEVKRRILMGTYALSAGYYDAFYKRAQKVRTRIQRDFSAALSRFDALVTPTAPTPAYKKGEKTADPLAMYVGDLMTVNVNLAGLPAISLPCGFAPGGPKGLPVGLQIIGAPFAEAQILHIAHAFEQTTPTWVGQQPPK